MKKLVATIALLILGCRVALVMGSNPQTREWLDRLTGNEEFLAASLNLELGSAGVENIMPDEEHVITSDVALPPFPWFVEVPRAPEPEPIERSRIMLPATVHGGMVISNSTSFHVNLYEMISEGPSLRLPSEGPQILIVHTHSTEAFTPEHRDEFLHVNNFRSLNPKFNIIRVGAELAASLESFGLNVIHHKGIYDYPSFTGSYSRTKNAINRYLSEHPGISVVLDIHRDAIGVGDVVYKTVAEGSGQPSAQVMLLVGTGENGLYHPNWRENLKFALYLQNAVISRHPTIPRPIALVRERYNQHLTTGSLIVEVGSSGNTLSEALTAIRMFAGTIGPALVALTEDGA